MQRKTRWFVAAALVALGQHRAGNPEARFCAADMADWAPDFRLKRSSPMLGIRQLQIHGYLASAGESAPQSPCIKPVPYWHMTASGAEAAKAAYQAARRDNPAAFVPRDPQGVVDPFSQRLWSLLRIRRALTADEAACVLVDAGDDITGTRTKCGALFLAWSRLFPDSLQVAAKRVDGFKRYVLVEDLGATAPTAPRATTAGGRKG